MAKVERGTFTVVSTGALTAVLNDYTLMPDYIVLSVTSNSGAERSLGGSDVSTNYSGNSGTYSDSSSTKSIQHYRNVSGVKTKTLEGVVTNFDYGEFSMDIGTRTETTQVSFVVYGH